jgi:hypothetical protein
MFISKRFAPAETKYTTTEREVLAIIWCLIGARWLVLGSKCTVKVYTYHSALITLLRQDVAHGRLGKWQVNLSEYDLEYVQIPGSQNQIADGMSRILKHHFAGEGGGMECTVKKWGEGKKKVEIHQNIKE